MSEDRIEALRRMLEKRPDDVRARFGRAAEYERLERGADVVRELHAYLAATLDERHGRWADVVRELQAYLASTEDQGNAWGRMGQALRQLGRDDDARAAHARGIEAALRHGHPSMAAEFEETLEDFCPRALAAPVA